MRRSWRRSGSQAVGRREGFTLFDAVLLAALAGVVALTALPRVRVRRVIAKEERVMETLRELAQRLDAHRAAARRDLDGDGRGEAPALGAVLTAADGFEASDSGRAWQRGGYWYACLVPGPDRVAREPSDDAALADSAEAACLLIAWPVEPGRSGMRAYLRTPVDGLLRHAIDGYPYGGPDRPPAPRTPLVERRAGTLQAAPQRGEQWIPPRETVTGRR